MHKCTFKDKSESANVLNNDLLNPDPSKSAQKITFSKKKQFQIRPTKSLNNIQVKRASYQKHLGIILDEKLNFKQHAHNAISKINNSMPVIRKTLSQFVMEIINHNIQSLF